MTDIVHYHLDWQGPFTYARSDSNSFLGSSAANKPGVYLWTFEYRDGYLIYIPGYTMTSFTSRLSAYRNLFRAGKYTILDGLSAQRGTRNEIWHGLNWDKRPGRKEEFLSNRVYYEGAADKMMGTMRIFLAPLPPEGRVPARAEAAIINILYSSVGPVHDLPDTNMQRSPRRPTETPFMGHSNAHVILHGLPEHFEA